MRDRDLRLRARIAPKQWRCPTLRKSLISALNFCPWDDTDVDNDGFIDNPGDDAWGAVIAFDFVDPVRVCSITLVDIDDGPATELHFHKTNGLTIIPVDNIATTRSRRSPWPFGAPLGLLAGMNITDQFQFLGVTIEGFNGNLAHPNKVILFDSENPTGDDFDLLTPGPGANNDEPLGLILIVAENDIDADNDGLVDDPDDEQDGGRMVFTFDEDVVFQPVKVLDVDGTEVDSFDFYDAANNLIETIAVGFAGDNSVQLITPAAPIPNVRPIELSIGGSGAVTRLRWCPQTSGK